MQKNHLRIFTLLLVGVCAMLCLVVATPPSSHHHPQTPTIIIKPPPPGPPILPRPTVAPGGTCPVPTPEMLKCIRQWACQYIIRLDLRCLLNLNGNPLLGGVLGGAAPPAAGGGGAGGAGGGLLGGILGL